MNNTYKCLILPENMFPEVDEKTYLNKTNEIQIVKATELTTQLNPDVVGYINDKNNKIHVDPALKKLLSIDAELMTTEKQMEDCEFILKQQKEFVHYRFISIHNLIASNVDTPKSLKEYLVNAIEFDIVDRNDWIYLPTKKYKWGSKIMQFWYEDSSLLNRFYSCVCFTDLNKTVLNYKNVLTYSNNRPLKQEEFSRIVSFLSDESSEQLALDILNTMNPTLSFIEILLAFNYIPEKLKKNKKKVLPLLQEIYKVSVDHGNYSLDEIDKLYRQHFDCSPTLNQLEFIADNYFNNNLEQSSIFDFKLKLKQK